jgi:putative ABC transport system substrate-binding protein
MNRRTFVGVLVGATLAPVRVVSAAATRPYRVGITSHTWETSEMSGAEPRSVNIRAFLSGLRDLGYVYGRDFVTEVRGGAGKPERYRAAVAELVGQRVDVIVSSGVMLAPLKQATLTIPIVMAGSSDPVGEGLVKTLARPGTNFTGLSHQVVETTGKRLELLKELVPGPAPVAVLRMRGTVLDWQAAEAAGRERGWKLVSIEVRDASDLEDAFKAATDARVAAILVNAGGPLFRHASRVAEHAARSRLPAMYPFRLYTEVGGLMSYSADLAAIWRRAAFFVDKILKGARPADLPVEQPTKFELVINMKAARALGLTVPPALLLRADQVID